MSEIQKQLADALDQLFSQGNPQEGDILVVGCSTSEVLGNKIGSSGSMECAGVIFNTINDFCKSNGKECESI